MKLYHLSFNGGLAGVWNPKIPDGYAGMEGSIPPTEPMFPRICLSSTLEGAFYAIYPNVSHFFEKHRYPHMDLYVYSPILRKDTRLLTPAELTKKRMVWDAHLTQEYDILTPVKMTLKGKVRFFNTIKEEWIRIRPFDDPKEVEREVCPPARYEYLATSLRW